MGSRVLYLRPWALNDPVKSSFQGKEQKKVPWAVEYQNDGLSWISPEVRSVCGPKLIDQIVLKRRVRKLGCVLDSL